MKDLIHDKFPNMPDEVVKSIESMTMQYLIRKSIAEQYPSKINTYYEKSLNGALNALFTTCFFAGYIPNDKYFSMDKVAISIVVEDFVRDVENFCYGELE